MPLLRRNGIARLQVRVVRRIVCLVQSAQMLSQRRFVCVGVQRLRQRCSYVYQNSRKTVSVQRSPQIKFAQPKQHYQPNFTQIKSAATPRIKRKIMTKTIGATRADIFEYVANQYGTQPEYLWASAPDYAVLRRQDNRKWYGIIMDVPCNRLGLDGNEPIDVLDLKCDPFAREILLQQHGFVPGYHLNKLHWIGVLLDGSVDKQLAYQLVDESYAIVCSTPRKRSDNKN